MGLSILSNSAATIAHTNITKSTNAATKSISRLSSGLKVSSASDDPAGLVISNKLEAQSEGLTQAISNVSDANNMIKTAEGAMNEVSSLLASMRTLALNAANSGANDSAAVAADQEQIKSAIESLNNISSETQFGNKYLLNGDSGVSTKVTSSSITSANLNSVSGLQSGKTSTITVDVTTAATRTVSTGSVAITAGTFTQDGSFYVNGTEVDYNAGDTIDNVVSEVNAVNSSTGVTASKTTDNKLVLTQDTYGSAATITTAQSDNVIGTAVTTAGKDAAATVKDSTGASIGGTWTGSGETLTDANGDTITLATTLTTATTLTGGIQATNNSLTFQVGAYAGQTRNVSIGSTAANNLGTTAINGDSVASIDVTTTQGAQDALKILDAAISQVSTQRANLGAFQTNVLDTTSNSLTTAQENISASKSSITDTDMASEMTTYTSENILQQAGISMLSQANSSGQQLLKLLQ